MKHIFITYSTIFLLPAFLLCASCTNRPQQNSDANESVHTTGSITTAAKVPKAPNYPIRNINDIQLAFKEVSTKFKDGVLDSVAFSYSCNNETSGTVSYFSEGGRLRLVVHRYNEYSHFSATDQYFVKDSALFFVYKNSVLWSFAGPQGATKDSITEERTYIINKKPVRCLQKTFVIRSHAASNPRSETVPGKEVNCASATSVIKPYSLLLKYRNKGTKGCLE